MQIIVYIISTFPCACCRFTALICLFQGLFVFLNFQPNLATGSLAFLLYLFAFHSPDQGSAISFSCHSFLRRARFYSDFLKYSSAFSTLPVHIIFVGSSWHTASFLVVFLCPCLWFYLIRYKLQSHFGLTFDHKTVFVYYVYVHEWDRQTEKDRERERQRL